MSINYELMKRLGPKQKGALTRAKKKGYAAVLATCTQTIKEWNLVGAWPDAWRIWANALEDARQHEMRTRLTFIPRTTLDSLG